MCRQEVEDEALYSMHIPASVYRVRGPQQGRLLHGMWWLSPSWDVASLSPCHPAPPGSGQGPSRGMVAAGRSCMWGGGVPCARRPLHVTGISSRPLYAPFSAGFPSPDPERSVCLLGALSPILPAALLPTRRCPAHGDVPGRGAAAPGDPSPAQGRGWAGPDAAPLPSRASWTGTAVAPTATTTTHRRVRS